MCINDSECLDGFIFTRPAGGKKNINIDAKLI
jgi:hypothetical protein